MDKEYELREYVIEIMLYYLNNNIPINKNFFDAIIKLYTEIYNLNEYLSNIIYLNTPKEKYNIQYIPVYKSLYINVCNLLIDTEHSLEYLNSQTSITNSEHKLATYIFYLINIIHDLRHIHQTSIINSKSNIIEEELLRIESKYLHNVSYQTMKKYKFKERYNKRINNLLIKYYDCLLCERLAEIYALEFILPLLAEIPNLKAFFNNNLKIAISSGYQVKRNGIIVPPTYVTIKEAHKIFHIKEFDYPYVSSDLEKTKQKVKKLSFDERIKLGLPVSNEELLNFYRNK